jgi:putative chitinase
MVETIDKYGKLKARVERGSFDLRVVGSEAPPGAGRAIVAEVQELLNARGFDAGAADGIAGAKTLAALAAAKAALHLEFPETVGKTTVDRLLNSAAPFSWADDNTKISKYFTVRDVTKGDPRRRPIPDSDIEKNILSLARELDKVREDWGGPIGVTSWYRPPAVNRAVGGAKNSQHINGRAADVYPLAFGAALPIGGNLAEFQAWLDKNWYGALGYGLKKGFVHLDIRNGKGWKSGGVKGVRWNY